MASVLPSPEEYPALTPRPGSPVCRAFNDIRIAATAGYATLLQVAHPTVGHGVHQYSSFTRDPWGRLLRTLDYVHGTVSGGPEMAGTIGARVRGMHTSIKGTKPDGGRYHAMEPEAFAWVHATLALAVIDGHRHFAREMTREQAQAFWTQWRDVGRLVGVRYRDLPESIEGFHEYVARTMEQELEWTPAIPEVLMTPSAARPPVPGLPGPVWKVLAFPLAAQFRIITTGLFPAELRARLDLPFSRSDELAFRAVAAGSRAVGPLVRGPLREFGPFYVKARRTALERGDVASVAHPPKQRRTADSAAA